MLEVSCLTKRVVDLPNVSWDLDLAVCLDSNATIQLNSLTKSIKITFSRILMGLIAIVGKIQ